MQRYGSSLGDEDLVRADLSPAKRAAHHAERFHEREHPQKPHGAVGVDTRGRVARVAILLLRRCGGTRADVATKTRTSEHTVQCEVARGESIPNLGLLADSSSGKPEHLGHDKSWRGKSTRLGAPSMSRAWFCRASLPQGRRHSSGAFRTRRSETDRGLREI